VNKLVLLLVLFFVQLLPAAVPAQSVAKIDAAKAKLQQPNLPQQVVLKTYFSIADEYMNLEQYDSAQIWLNKIHNILSVKEISLSNYFLLSRQAEVYYYNNLQQLGLQESRKGLVMAQTLNDSLLMADSYNFLGLFYMNIDSNEIATDFFTKSLSFAKQSPYPLQYLGLTTPHHIYGNTAENFYKQKKYSEALPNYYLSIKKATEINVQRGIAVAHAGLGDVYLALQKTDSANINYNKAIAVAKTSNDIDVALISYGGLGKCYFESSNAAKCKEVLTAGFNLLNQHPNTNRFFALLFLNSAADIYKKLNSNGDLIRTLELKSAIERANIDGNNKQIQTILNAGMANETKVLSLQVQEAKQKQQLANTRLIFALAGISLLIISFLVYRYYQNQKLAVVKLRQNISQDLHDDIGASLSSLQIYSAVAEDSIKNNPGKAIEMLQKIKTQSRNILENMGDIVWSMNTNNTGGTTLEAKIKNYISELFSDSSVEFSCAIQPEADAILTNIKARKNVLLVVREILNNALKYSNANKIMLHIYLQDKNWVMDISDNGTGFDATKLNTGNGLKNIQQRCHELSGACSIDSNNGTHFICMFPLTVISNTRW
jgi:signal transduction histidine kinase